MTEQKTVFQKTETEATPSEEGEKPAGRRLVSMADLGQSLPVGNVDSTSGKLVKSFSTKVWRTKEERELGKLRKPEMSIGRYAGTIVGHMCRELGGVDLASIEKPEERFVHVQRMYMGDVFYVYCYLRREALGSKLEMDVECPTCSEKIPWVGDMDTIEVAVVDDLAALRWDFELRDPIELRKKKVSKFQMSAPRWSLFNEKDKSLGEVKVNTVRSAIVGLNDDEDLVILTADDLDEVSKRDLEAIISGIDKRFVGPNMSVEAECPRCDADFRVAINWTYENFFGTSSP